VAAMRSGYINQVEHLAQLGANSLTGTNNSIATSGDWRQHSNGVLSRLKPSVIEDHPLPGPKGRGAILVRFGEGPEALVVVMMHLALGARTRTLQLAYIRELIGGYKHQVLMGDMNTHASDLLQNFAAARPRACWRRKSKPRSPVGVRNVALIIFCSAQP
jgi:endonuclease/exonuclease/phosphatase family metal-dependent hydrolase